MTERPILFSAPMVRALLAGTKTQTRRVVKHVKYFPDFGCAVGRVGGAWKYGSPAALGLRERGDHWSVVLDGNVLERMCTSEAYGWGAGSGCPYGQPGDRLWVRETWMDLQGTGVERVTGSRDRYAYGADTPRGSYGDDQRKCFGLKWRPSIHMPRAASRITLEVTGVRVEQLQDISRGEAMAEGCPFPNMSHGDDPRRWYADLWEQINGDGSWEANPWVWVVEFKKIGGST